MTLYFKVKTGYGAMDFISIDETEIDTAQRAMVTGKVALFKEGTVAGNHISSIVPDWNKELGLSPSYSLNGSDMSAISRARKAEYMERLANASEEIRNQIGGRSDNLKLT